MKNLLSIMTVIVLVCSLCIGCSKGQNNQTSVGKDNGEISESNTDGISSGNKEGEQMDNEVKEDTTKTKKAILVVSFGTSYAETRKKTIEAVESKIAETYKEYDTKRAFTSSFIIKKLKERDNILVDTPKEALEKLKNEGYKEVIVQPLHILHGSEYDELTETLAEFNDGTFDKFAFGKPVLSSIEDYNIAANALTAQLPKLETKEAVVLMGHGTEHPANSSYACFQKALNDNGLNNVYVGTVEGYPTLNDVIKKLKEDEIKKVTLMPFMLVAGDHANNDMAGDEDDSWKNILQKEGFEVNIYLHGLGENKDYHNIYLDHVQDAIDGKGQKIPEKIKLENSNDQIISDKKGILVVSFGTSHADTRALTIEATENKIADEYKDYEVRRAFTSEMIIKILKERDNTLIDTPEEALKKMRDEGFEEVIIQPLHIIPGSEYNDLVKVYDKYASAFKKIAIGTPILYSIEDYTNAVNALKSQLPQLNKGEAVVLMGHGTEHQANSSYACYQSVLENEGIKNVYVGTVEGYPSLDNVIKDLHRDNISNVTLMPLMLVAGDHAKNDMAGDEEDSWKSILEKEGFNVNVYLHGLGENADFQNIYKQHVKDAMESMDSDSE